MNLLERQHPFDLQKAVLASCSTTALNQRSGLSTHLLQERLSLLGQQLVRKLCVRRTQVSLPTPPRSAAELQESFREREEIVTPQRLLSAVNSSLPSSHIRQIRHELSTSLCYFTPTSKAAKAQQGEHQLVLMWGHPVGCKEGGPRCRLSGGCLRGDGSG